MIYHQKISYSPSLAFLVSNSKYVQDIVFSLLVLLNVIIIVNVKYENESYKHRNSALKNIFTVFYIIHLILSFIQGALLMIERYPLLAYYKSMRKRKSSEKIKGVFKKTFLILTDIENLYSILYCIISCLALRIRLCYAILLIDFIKRSQDLRDILKVLALNCKKLLKILCLAIILIYIYSLIGMISIDNSFINVIQKMIYILIYFLIVFICLFIYFFFLIKKKLIIMSIVG